LNKETSVPFNTANNEGLRWSIKKNLSKQQHIMSRVSATKERYPPLYISAASTKDAQLKAALTTMNEDDGVFFLLRTLFFIHIKKFSIN
jgi:hypothetical protein